jgi:hypothetical protein
MCHRVSVGLLLLSLFWIDAADAQRAPRGATSWLLSVSESQVTADINRIPLRVVLEELARQVPLRFSLSEESREHPVTAHFPALPLEEALARLLTGLTYALVISVPAPPATASAETKQVVELLVSKKAPQAMIAGGKEASAVTAHTGPRQDATLDPPAEWTAALQHPDRAVRVEALQRWAEQGAATPLYPLTQALVDPDESVRARAQALVEQVFAATAETRGR